MICPTCLGVGEVAAGMTESTPAKIKRLLLTTSMSYQDIANTVGAHKSTVGYYAKKYEVKRIRTDALKNPDTIDRLIEDGKI